MRCKRDWIAYTDCLEEMSGRLKARYDPGMAARVYNDYLHYIDILIGMRGGRWPLNGQPDWRGA